MSKNHFVFIASILTLSLNLACEDKFKAKVPGELKSEKASVRITATVHAVNELPLCEPSSQGLAGYVSPADYFVKCSGGRWHEVTPGSPAFSYVARAPVRYYEWEDSIAKKRWFIPLETEIAAEDLEDKGCGKGWKLPSREELLLASSNGLIEGIKSHGGRSFDKAWTADFQMVDGVSQRIAINLAAKSDDVFVEKKTAAGLYCVSFAGN